jgi:hypothetical protein
LTPSTEPVNEEADSRDDRADIAVNASSRRFHIRPDWFDCRDRHADQLLTVYWQLPV